MTDPGRSAVERLVRDASSHLTVFNGVTYSHTDEGMRLAMKDYAACADILRQLCAAVEAERTEPHHWACRDHPGEWQATDWRTRFGLGDMLCRECKRPLEPCYMGAPPRTEGRREVARWLRDIAAQFERKDGQQVHPQGVRHLWAEGCRRAADAYERERGEG